MSFKDLFSTQSKDYALYRPTYPKPLYSYLAGLAPQRSAVWDCGTGNGQAAIELVAFFDKVYATDTSEKQLSQAVQHPKIQYLKSSAENSTLPEASVDLVTVAQAYHWFNKEFFFKELRRVARPHTHLALWSYSQPRSTPEITQVINYLYKDILADYWEKERRIVDEGYRNEILPFKEIQAPSFEMKAQWGFDQFIGYMNTWSSVQTYIKKNQSHPVELIASDFRKAWGSAEKNEMKWSFVLRVFEI